MLAQLLRAGARSTSGSGGKGVLVPGRQEFAQVAVYAWRSGNTWVVPCGIEFGREDRVALPVGKLASGFGYDQGSGCEIPDLTLFLDVAIEPAGRNVAELCDRAAKVADPCAGGCQSLKVAEWVFTAVPLHPEDGSITEPGPLELQSAAFPEGA